MFMSEEAKYLSVFEMKRNCGKAWRHKEKRALHAGRSLQSSYVKIHKWIMKYLKVSKDITLKITNVDLDVPGSSVLLS